jgi:hypothetical protein
LPLHAYRRFVEDRKPVTKELQAAVGVEVKPSEADS